MRLLLPAAFALLALAAAPADKTQIDWVRVPGGAFEMGGEDYPREKPVHTVRVREFEMGRTEVTNRQYQACVEAGACTLPDLNCLAPSLRGHEQPAVCVSWFQARAFAKWAGGRLPSESEWEYAARSAGRAQRYPWGDSPPTCHRAVFAENPYKPGCGRGSTWPVCSKPRGNTKQGLCDMAGNVWEWTEDWYHDSYEGAPSDGSAWLGKSTSSFRSDRGGQWDGLAVNLRVFGRDSEDPEIISERGTGFRVARDAPKR
ncbi:MAG: hypothetical protein COV48_09700 [Elusimicrobia bacterium CG11_big_fil_rev_8_21_14_0_20_64_6]|nr:MAG: hypothetical protein COV48_09700 [Elusimicrobia bacterium CG11_big_fil_rev_8_21_14_0_20_64_6]